MWITQTYLGTVEPNANVFVYYLYEDYNQEQKEFTKKVQREFGKLGEAYNNNVSLLMPNPKYADKIEAEVREIRPLWELIYEELPGLLISEVPLAQLEKKPDKCYFIPLDTKTSLEARDTIRTARTLINRDLLSVRLINNGNPSIYKKIGEACEIKLGFCGIKIDLKKLFFNR